MSLIRYRPIPSDRMTAIWTFLGFRDGVVLEYGPAGTTNFAKRYMSGIGLDTDRLVCTHIGQEDIIMGNVSRLERALEAADRDFSPRVIFVVPSSLLAVVGSDIAGVCHYMQEHVRAKLISYDGGGFVGDFSAGLSKVYSELVKELVTPTDEVIPDTYNILGVSANTPSAGADAAELRALMDEAFKAKQIFCLGDTGSTKELEGAGRAAVNLVLRAEALPAAKWLEKHCMTPYIYPAPYGFEGTLNWLFAVGNAVGKSPAAELVSDIRRREGEVSADTVRPVSIFGEYDQVAGLSGLLREMNMPAASLVCSHSLSRIQAPTEGIIAPKTEKEWMQIAESLCGQFVLADEDAAGLCRRDNKVLTLTGSSEGNHDRHREVSSEQPLVGLRGAERISEFLSGRS